MISAAVFHETTIVIGNEPTGHCHIILFSHINIPWTNPEINPGILVSNADRKFIPFLEKPNLLKKPVVDKNAWKYP